jgi:DNA-binding CsgD family transcriptional regulator
MQGSHTPTSVGHPQEPDRGLQLVSSVSHGLAEQLAGAIDGHLATFAEHVKEGLLAASTAVGAAGLPRPARLLAAADAYQCKTEPRPYRPALMPEQATQVLVTRAEAGGLDPEMVAAVTKAAGQPAPHIKRPAGLTEREVEVIGLLARGRATKQIAASLGISTKTADRHIQNIYGKIGVSSRAAATLYAAENGLVP